MAFWPLRNGPEPSWPLTSGALDTVTVTASSTPHTKGAWTEVIASTSSIVQGFILSWSGTSASATNTQTLLDVGVGGAGSEVVILPNWQVGFTQAAQYAFIPLAIQSGVRVAVRSQSVIADKAATVSLIPVQGATLGGGGIRTFSTCTTYGADLTTSGSTLGNLSGGAWVEAVASTVRANGAIRVSLVGANPVSGVSLTVQAGVGGSGSETTVDWNVNVATGSSETINQPLLPWTALTRLSIPVGSRVAVRGVFPGSATNLYPIVHLFS